MRFTTPEMSEHNVASHFEYLCAMQGSQRPAYVPVVASGSVQSAPRVAKSPAAEHLSYRPNALIIHYTSNNQLIRNGEMILIDAGCEYKSVAMGLSIPFLPLFTSHCNC